MSTVELTRKELGIEMMERVRVVCQCLYPSLKPDRKAIQSIKVERKDEGTDLIATDGKVLCVTTTDMEIEPGLYSVIKNTKTKVVLIKSGSPDDYYPNWIGVVPDTKHATKIKVNTSVEAIWAAARLACFIDPGVLTEKRMPEEIGRFELYIPKDGPLTRYGGLVVIKAENFMLVVILWYVNPDNTSWFKQTSFV